KQRCLVLASLKKTKFSRCGFPLEAHAIVLVMRSPGTVSIGSEKTAKAALINRRRDGIHKWSNIHTFFDIVENYICYITETITVKLALDSLFGINLIMSHV